VAIFPVAETYKIALLTPIYQKIARNLMKKLISMDFFTAIEVITKSEGLT